MRCISVASDHIVVVEDSEEAFQLYFQAGFLPDFPQSSLRIGFIHFNKSADQAPPAVVCPALEEDPAVPDNQRSCTVQDELPRTGQAPEVMNIVHPISPPILLFSGSVSIIADPGQDSKKKASLFTY